MFSFAIKGLKEFGRFANSANARAHQRSRKQLKITASKLGDMFERTFRSGGPSGKKWKKLKPSTKMQRQMHEGYYERPHKTGILLWSGGLLASLIGGMQPPSAGRKYAIRKIQRGCVELVLGTAHPLALTHHKGSTHRRGPIAPTSARSLKMYNKGGRPFFRGSAGPATINIPARPLYSEREVQKIFLDYKQRMGVEFLDMWKNIT